MLGLHDCLDYGYSFAMTCLKESNEMEEEEMKKTALSIRVGRFAKDKDFKNFMKPTKKNNKQTSREDLKRIMGGR